MMRNVFFAVIAIVGTVIGSGFISGKEIAVFFSRFGYFSYFCILLVFLLFFIFFRYILNRSEFALKRLSKSRISFYSNLILCLIFSSAMFAGISNSLSGMNTFIKCIMLISVVILCFLVYKNGMGSLERLNVIFIPLMIFLFVFNLFSIFEFKNTDYESTIPKYLSFIYAILYVFLNLSNGSILICRLGQKLTKKQRTRVAFYSALVLFLILLLTNIVLLQNQSSFIQDMPLLSLFNGFQKVLMSVVIFVGCITTLFSLVYTSSFSMRGLCKNEFLIFLVSVLFPLILSLLGFSFIVLYLYPLASVLGGEILIDLFFISFFKRADKKIHSSSENTK